MSNLSVVLVVLAFFLAAALGLAMAFLTPVREWAAGRVRRLQGHAQSAGRVAAEATGRGARMTGARARSGAIDASHWVGARRWMLVGSLATLTLVPLAAWWMRAGSPLQSYDHTATQVASARITAMLEGEQLVPPPPLPPELFMTPEVEQARPMIRWASREWELLDAQFRQQLLQVFRTMREQHGYELVLLEGYRSPERQRQLAASSESGTVVTRAGAGMSYHQYGLAADVAFLRAGRIVISERDPWAMRGYELYGDVARAAGLTWGGAWQSIRDYGHVELRRPGVLRAQSTQQGH